MEKAIVISIDLVAAAGKSHGPLAKLSQQALQRLEQRYRRFLQLARDNPKNRLSPGHDIDEMWHLHMLHPVAYLRDCLRNFNAILDHNPGFGLKDDSEWQQLNQQFNATGALWQQAFGDAYNPDQQRAPASIAEYRAARMGGSGATVCESEMIGSGSTVCESEMIGSGSTVCESEMITASLQVCESEMIGNGVTVCEAEMTDWPEILGRLGIRPKRTLQREAAFA